MHLINIPTAKQLILEIAIRINEPLMLVGQFGAGKTEGAAQAVAEAKAMLCDVRLGQYDTVDLKGSPWVDGKFTVWYPASTLPLVGNDRFPDDQIIVLILDEITSCPPAVFGVAYQLINERRIGEHVLKPNVRIVAAGNRESDKGIVNRMPMPLANRMTWAEVGIDVDAWCEYAQSKGWPPIFIALLQFRKPLLCTYDPTKNEKVVATPRTWEKAIKYYVDPLLSKQLKIIGMAGSVGDGPAGEFWGFEKVWMDIVPTAEIIKNPMDVRLPKEGSLKYAQTVSVSGSMDVANIDALYSYIERYDTPEFLILAMQLACKRDSKLYATKAFDRFSKKFKTVFQS
jgi:hypothetical protein